MTSQKPAAAKLLRSLKGYYWDSLNFMNRLHLLVKLRKNNAMLILENYIPKEAKILDVGCGHGLFCNLLLITSNKREICGIDIDKQKIKIAKNSVGYRKGIRFLAVDITKINETFDVVVVYDVIHHIDYHLQLSFLKECFKRLKKDGLLIIKDVNIDYFIRSFIFCYLVDELNSRLNITKGDGRAFLHKKELFDIVSGANFKDIRLGEIHNRDITPHLIMTARKIS